MLRSPEKLRVTAEVVSLRASQEMGRTMGKTIRVLLRAGKRVEDREREEEVRMLALWGQTHLQVFALKV